MKTFLSAFALISLFATNFNVVGQDAIAELHSAIKPVSRSGGWLMRHESMNERVKQGNVDLIFVGDSITQGWEGAGREVWGKYYGSRNAVNLGIGGDRTQHVLWRFENGNIDGISPQLAVVMIGTNNAGANTPEETAEGVTEIVNMLRAKLPDTKILLLAIFPRGPNEQDKYRQKNTEVNEIISKLDDGEMIHYLDIAEAFLEADGTLQRSVMPDLLHLNADSYTKWADAIEPSIKELMTQ